MSNLDMAALIKAFSPKVLARALRKFDSSLMVIVGVCWGGAIVLMLMAMYTVHLSVGAKRDLIQAMASEPSLPKMEMTQPNVREMEPLIQRLQKRHPELVFVLGRDSSLTITANEPSKFRLWLTILSYVDTMSPQYRWQIQEICVGNFCGSSVPMRAILTPKKISFSAPKQQSSDKNK